MMDSIESRSESENLARVTPGKRRIFIFCLLLSLMVHGATALLVLFSSATSQPVATTHYIDLTATPFPAAAPPEIHAPAPAVAPKTAQEQPKKEIPKEEMPATPPAVPATVSADVISTPLGLGMAHGYFKSLAEGRTLRDEIRVYYFEILEKINVVWWQKAGTLNESAHQDGIVDISIGPDGVLQGARIVSTTGSAEVDRAIVQILRESSPFAPPPISFGQDSFRAPLRIAAPSNLFRLGGK